MRSPDVAAADVAWLARRGVVRGDARDALQLAWEEAAM